MIKYEPLQEVLDDALYEGKIEYGVIAYAEWLEKESEINKLIKTKQVNIHFDLVVKDTYEEYLSGIGKSKKYLILTEEEWTMLKEWLESE